MGYPTAMRGVIVYAKWQGVSTSDSSNQLGISGRTINEIWARVLAKGFDPKAPTFAIADETVVDAPRSGRPNKKSDELKQLIISKIEGDQSGDAKTLTQIAEELSAEGINVSRTMVGTCLKELGVRKIKPPRELIPAESVSQARPVWTLAHRPRKPSAEKLPPLAEPEDCTAAGPPMVDAAKS